METSRSSRMRAASCLSSGRTALVLAGLLLSGAAAAQTAEPPTVGRVWLETVMGNPERPGGSQGSGFGSMPADAYEVKDGVYRSVLSRIKLKVPRIADETKVDVREAIAMRRQDGTVATTHLVFMPGGLAYAAQPETPVSAVVVTRLRDDRPKDRDSVLRSYEPQSEAEKAQYARVGIEQARIQTRLGEALQRVVPNRAYGPAFPYSTQMLRDSTLTTVGVSRFFVFGQDSFVEFSQVYPCGPRGAAECRAAALEAAERFTDGVVEFLTLPKDFK